MLATRCHPGRPWIPCFPLGVVLALVVAAPSLADEFTGEFEGDGLHLRLELDDAVYTGAIQLGEDVFLCSAERGGPGLVGTFESDDGEYAFQVEATRGGLVLTSGGGTFRLERLGGGGANPLAGGGKPNPLAGGASEPTAAPPTSAAAAWSGRYESTIQGTAAVLTLEERSGRVSGEIDAGGYLYRLDGTHSGRRASGEATDPQVGGRFRFEATASDGSLELVFVIDDPRTGQQQRLPLTFHRPGRSQDATGDRGGSGSAPPGPRDPALVGLWRQSESMSGGDASMVVESYLQINADGTWAAGGGRAVGGGAGWGGDTGSGGVEERGYWKSEGRIVYIQAPGSGQWQPFAQYYVEPQKLMFTFGDGSRQLLYRVR